MRVLSAEEMQKIDHQTANDYGISGIVLMENAGRWVAQAATDILAALESNGAAGSKMASVWLEDEACSPSPAVIGKKVVCVCGTGNNGGDGFVAARHLTNLGVNCSILLLGDVEKIKGDAYANHQAAMKLGIPVRSICEGKSRPGNAALAALREADLVVDALLGTGLRGDIRPEIKMAVDAINQCGSPVLSIDIPSGVDSDTGRVSCAAVIADVTVTFAAPKLGHILYPGTEYCGDVLVADIGIPTALLNDKTPGGRFIIKPDNVASWLPERTPDSHKGTYGHAGILAGSAGFTGAAIMAGQACTSAGAGLTTVACPSAQHPVVAAQMKECMTLPLGRDEHFFTAGCVEQALAAMDRWDAVAIGCGIGQHEATIEFVRNIIPNLGKPFVLDADALNCMGRDAKELLSEVARLGVLTPHPGEMARLLGTDTAWVQSNRVEAATTAADNFGSVCVLKGAHTITAEPGGRLYFNLTGNPSLAKGGSGDILTGIIVSLLAQGLSPFEAATAGVWIHGKSADIACETQAVATMLATDCLKALPEVFRLLEECALEAHRGVQQ